MSDLEWNFGEECTSASRAVMYFTSPISATLRLTSLVRATGEKTARAPDCRRTTVHVSKKPQEAREMDSIPIVPLPPTFILPNRKKGTESVVTVLGTTSRMTITFSGSEGTSLEDMLEGVIV